MYIYSLWCIYVYIFIYLYVGKYCDVPLGLYIVRGDNIVLMGDIGDLDESTANFEKITPEQLSMLSEQIEIEGDKVEWDFDWLTDFWKINEEKLTTTPWITLYYSFFRVYHPIYIR